VAKKDSAQQIVVWDKEVAECFELWGGQTIATYFECLRYKQQITPDKGFVLSSREIQQQTGLGLWKQQNARKVLEGSGWIETQRDRDGIRFAITDLARDAIKHIPHKRNVADIYKRFRFSTGQR
jgi:hypothetical protein